METTSTLRCGWAQKSATKIQSTYRLFSFRLERWRAAILAQRFVRKYKLRWLVKTHRSSTLIQALFRGYAQRLRFRVLAFEAFRKALLESEFRSMGISPRKVKLFHKPEAKHRERSKNRKGKLRQLRAVHNRSRSMQNRSKSDVSSVQQPLVEFLDEVRSNHRSASGFGYGGGSVGGSASFAHVRQSNSAGAAGISDVGGTAAAGEGIHANYILPPVKKVKNGRKRRLLQSLKSAKQRAAEREWREFRRQLKMRR